jgi:YD repeat-containing protein
MSRLTSEDRQFNGPLSATTFTLSYQYTLSGQLKSVTDLTSPSSQVSFSYDIDRTGQATAVESSNLGATTPLAHDMKYRASGALDGMSYGNGTGLSFSYNSRGLVTHYGVSGVTSDGQYGAFAHGSDFDYYADGRVKYASDLFTDALSTKLHDRAYSYDHAGRLQEAYSGADANQLETGTASGVEGAFRQSYTYDPFGNTKGRTGRLWSADDNDTEPFVATGRNTAWEYDPDGRLVSRNETTQNGLTPYQPLRSTYDAAGRSVTTTQTTTNPSRIPNHPPGTTTPTETETYDGTGLVAAEVKSGTGTAGTTYYLRSTVLGGKAVSEYNGSGARQVTHVPGGGGEMADSWNNTGTPYLNWKHVNPVTGDELDTDSNGAVTSKATLDPAGFNVGDSDPASGTTGGDSGGMSQAQMNKMYAQMLPPSLGGDAAQVSVDGFQMNASVAFNLVSMGAARVATSSQSVLPIYSRSQQAYVGLAVYNAQAAANGIAFLGAGSLGYLPAGSTYTQGVGIEFQSWFGSLYSGGNRFGYGEGESNFLSEKAAQVIGLAFIGQGAPQNPRVPLTQKDVYTARRNIRNMLENPVCNNFIKGMLEEFGKLPQGVYSTDILKIFDAVRAQGSGGLFRDISQTGSVAYAFGSLERGNATIAFGYSLNGSDGMHETMHVAARTGSGFSHQEMAQAAITSAQAMVLVSRVVYLIAMITPLAMMGLRLGTPLPLIFSREYSSMRV